MTTRASGPVHRLTIEIRTCGSGEGFDVDAQCGGCGWAWLGWAPDAPRAAEEASTEWTQHARRTPSVPAAEHDDRPDCPLCAHPFGRHFTSGTGCAQCVEHYMPAQHCPGYPL